MSISQARNDNETDLNVDFIIEKENILKSAVLYDNNHFRNVCLRMPSTYSCAIDCFFEISYRVILNYITRIPRSVFF